MPTVPSANLNAPIMMVAEKGSDMIKTTWRPKKKDASFASDKSWGRNNLCLCPNVQISFPDKSTTKQCF